MGMNYSLSWDNGLKLAFTKYTATCIFFVFENMLKTIRVVCTTLSKEWFSVRF